MSQIITRFTGGNMFSNVIFKSKNKSYLLVRKSGCIITYKNLNYNAYDLEFLSTKMTVKLIGMDSNGIMRVYCDMGIQYPLIMDYRTINFKGGDVYGTLLDDLSFGVFEKNSDEMMYRAKIRDF